MTCTGCDAKHLIADNLGWFGDRSNVETMGGTLVDRAEVLVSPDGTVTVTEK